jgi:proline iminopeptidase
MSVVESDAESAQQRLVRPASRAIGPPARVVAALIGGLLAGGALAVVARRVSVRTGVSDEEAFGSLPGDEVISHPMVEWTRGVTVQTTPERVWPWLVQMGYGRGGWYTPEWVDLFANRWVFGAKSRFPRSAGRLLPEYQHIAVGDLICDGPDYASYFRVQRVEPYKALVYRSIRHPRRGSPIDITDPESPRRVERQLLDAGTYVDFSWTLVLGAVSSQRTRLLVRTRALYSPQALRLLVVPLGLFDATYGVAMLRAIARRAEGRAPRG